ncbi:hypothetical protein SDC9_198568 [bioreactor metagenome]|uniref:Uncharacterized protein n=1 Tax=bioreactor metagenome TaxID=1076179 RepID=A0A645IHZ7_9ZZZZ
MPGADKIRLDLEACPRPYQLLPGGYRKYLERGFLSGVLTGEYPICSGKDFIRPSEIKHLNPGININRHDISHDDSPLSELRPTGNHP